jgi:small nuclear ribonucleoprotein (snRNP)-like protein
MDCDTKHEDNLESPQSTFDPRAKIKSWLGRILRIVITDGRIIVGCFACTDREGNVILENSYEYAQSSEQEPKLLGLALVPGKHIVSVSLMT